ncbi:MAG: hypothetical protein B6242_14650 [Anaerolineaceae bacterium 4572_78]|nr:MAG: hypothetical protein B6242_14650 [Anaerolineaceae bacterium 4572_78]
MSMKDTIMVAQGTYLPGSNRTDTFQLKDGVDIYGGFAGTHGTEGDFDVRDWQTYITILSGDIGVPNYTDDNTYHVVTGNNTNDTILDGFTISDGYANGSSWDDKVGAGMFNKDGHPTVRNIIFTDNYAYYNGGGMANTNGSMPTIENVIFSDNSTTQYNGGGLYNHYSHPTLKYITFQNNTASSGGGLYNYYSNPQFSHVTFYGNSAVSGGAIYNYVSQPTFSHMVLSGNTANVGGGIYNNNGKITLYQSALSSNSATSNGDDIYDVNGHIMLDNTILWGNITPVYTSVNSVITSNNTIIQSGQFGGTDTDPLFIDSDGEDNVLGTPDDNLRLSDKSPAIDMGDTASLPADFADIDNDNNQTEQVPFDLDNNPRISGDFVDVGAYEFQWIYYPDFIITKTVTPQSNIIYHDMVTYTIILENIGEADATSMSLTDTLALETDFAYWLESPKNYVPIATSQVFTTIEDIAISNMLTASDLRNDPLTYTVITSGTKGTVHISPTVGMFNYTPFTDSYGTDNFAYHAYDGELTSNLAIITITITPANDEPIAHGGHVTTYEETAVDGRLLATDVESDTLSYILFSLPLKGQVTISDTDTGTFIYTPITNAVGSDMFTFKVADEKSSSNIAVISITIIATNDMPIAFANQFATVEDMPLLGELIATDVDGDVLSYTIVSSTSKGTLHITDTTSGQFSYMPNQDENGADSFTFNVMDGQLESNTAMVSLTITATNDAPLASDAHVGTHRNVAFTGTLLALDVDNETLTYTLMTSATKGTVKLTDMHAGIYDYVPDEDVYGHDQFTFMVHDGWLNSNIATISVTITLSNSIPIAEDLNLTTYEDMPLLGILQATDVENDPLTYTIITPPMHGTLVMTDTHVGIFRYMPNANVHGFDYFTYQAYDIVGGNIAVVSITITATNDMPQALSADASIVEDIAYDGIMSATDIDHDVLTYTVLTYPTKGTLYHSDIYTGAFQYVPAENINGMDSFSFRVHDGEVESNIALISMTITAVNDAPVAITDTATISKNTAIDLHVLQNDSDADDDTLQIQDATTSLNGTVVIINTHIISYTPNNDFVGKDSFSYTVSDGQLSDEGQVNIIVIDNVTPTPNPTVPPTMTPTMAITLTATNTPTPTMTATATPHMDMTATATPHMDMTATATPHMDMTATITPKPSATPMLMGVLQVEPQNFMIIATEGDTNTYTHNFSIDYQGEVVPQWTATSNVNWLILDNTTGTGRKVIEAKARVQNLAVGIHHAKITIEAASMLHSPYIIDVWLVVNSISGTPLPEPVSQTIPPEGGTLSLPDGCATVEFPSDAVSDNPNNNTLPIDQFGQC